MNINDLKQNYTELLIEFVKSDSFKDFEKIVEGIYFDNLIAFHSSSTKETLEKDKAVLDFMIKFPDSLKQTSKRLLEKKLLEKENSLNK